MKKRFVLIITLLFAISLLVSCKTDNGEKTVLNFLKAYYTVNQKDFDYYQQMANDAKASGDDEYNKSYESHTKKFKQYLSNSSYKFFDEKKASYTRIADAFNNNYFAKISSIKITGTEKDKKAKTITYNYTYQFSEVNKDTKKTKKMKLSGALTVKKENNNWKIINSISGN
ncbi:hypothetical protein [Clostridium oryzae]|uniref:Lumazine-binding domain protein n=1 Tax=Clostridium oryzae TaxID=1450648 RepID=A0A1V4IPL9_9CLOT|nr:hypothetical protein [Clostridium oryzae]OPJ61962.1 hypothetical protein CLORY_20540 [Clostridium oryzae]